VETRPRQRSWASGAATTRCAHALGPCAHFGRGLTLARSTSLWRRWPLPAALLPRPRRPCAGTPGETPRTPASLGATPRPAHLLAPHTCSSPHALVRSPRAAGVRDGRRPPRRSASYPAATRTPSPPFPRRSARRAARGPRRPSRPPSALGHLSLTATAARRCCATLSTTLGAIHFGARLALCHRYYKLLSLAPRHLRRNISSGATAAAPPPAAASPGAAALATITASCGSRPRLLSCSAGRPRRPSGARCQRRRAR
jgi:hypothetical protein